MLVYQRVCLRYVVVDLLGSTMAAKQHSLVFTFRNVWMKLPSCSGLEYWVLRSAKPHKWHKWLRRKVGMGQHALLPYVWENKHPLTSYLRVPRFLLIAKSFQFHPVAKKSAILLHVFLNILIFIDVLFPLVGWLLEGFEETPLTGKWW
jgi:hypothetical protein